MDARASLGQGQINLTKFAVLSSAFYAESQGVIPIADVLTNSPLNLPVNLALRRSLAEKARLVPVGAPTNTAYVSLPTFVKLTGTLGDPKSQTDKLVIAGLLARSATRFIPNVGGDAGKILQGVGNILTSQGAAAPNVNAPTNTRRRARASQRIRRRTFSRESVVYLVRQAAWAAPFHQRTRGNECGATVQLEGKYQSLEPHQPARPAAGHSAAQEVKSKGRLEAHWRGHCLAVVAKFSLSNSKTQPASAICLEETMVRQKFSCFFTLSEHKLTPIN